MALWRRLSMICRQSLIVMARSARLRLLTALCTALFLRMSTAVRAVCNERKATLGCLTPLWVTWNACLTAAGGSS